MQVERLIARIRGQLELGTPDLEARSLAGEYVALCQRARERLEQCSTLIRSGNEHAAYQVAESEPDLLTLCAELSFAESERWNALCRERGLPTAFPLDGQHVMALEGLYGKEIGENHPLYRDYRDAIRKRDEDRALSILRSIVRINANDPNARSELSRLSAKFLREALGKVTSFFAAQQNADAVNLMNRMERFGANELADEPQWEQALAKRVAWLRSKAVEQIEILIKDASQARQGGHWEQCASNVGRARALERDHQINLASELKQELTSLEAWAGQLAAADEAEASLRAATQTLLEEWLILKQEATQTGASAILVSRLGSWLEKSTPLADRLPEGLIRQVRQLRQAKRAGLSRRYTILITSWVFGLLVLLGVLYSWYNQNKLTTEADERLAAADRLVAASDYENAERSLDEFNSKKPKPEFIEAIKALRKQIAELRETEQRLLVEAVYLQARRLEGISLANIEATFPRATKYQNEVSKVGPISQARLKKTFADPVGFLAECTRQVENAKNDLTLERQNLVNALRGNDLTTDVSRAQEVIDRLRTLLRVLKACGIKDLEEANTEVSQATVRLDAERKSAGAIKSLEVAADLKSYLSALSNAAQNTADKSDLGKRAAFIVERSESLRNLPRSALAPRVAAMWDQALKPNPQGVFQPPTYLEAETKILKSLADETVLKALRKYTVLLNSSQGTRPVRTAYIIGELSQEKNLLGTNGIEYILKGKELLKDGTTVDSTWRRQEFNNGSHPGEYLEEALSIPELDYLRQFGRFHDAKTGKLLEPLLRTMDRVRRNPSTSFELRAFQLQELYRIASLRPEAWGFIFSPSAQREADQLRRITQNTMGPYDFLFKEKWADVQNELKPFMLHQAGASYAEEARFWHATFHNLRNRNLIFAGMIGRDGKPVLREALTDTALYGIDTDGQAKVLFRVDNAGATERIAEAAPLSPLLRYPGSVTEATQAARIPAGLTPPEGGWEALLQGRDL